MLPHHIAYKPGAFSVVVVVELRCRAVEHTLCVPCPWDHLRNAQTLVHTLNKQLFCVYVGRDRIWCGALGRGGDRETEC